jgi:hypothetical protein
MFLRGILGVNKTTSIFVVSGEFGRYLGEHLWQQTLKYYHSYDILGGGMLWKPKEARILTNFIDQPV